jgi:hypothetical protein
MTRLFRILLLLLALLFLSTPVIRAEEDVDVGDEEEDKAGSTGTETEDEYEEVDDGEVGPHENVHILAFFPEHKKHQFYIDEPVTVLLGFKNDASESFNITTLGAHFHSPYDLSYFIQNFTRRYVSVSADPGQQVTLEYKFTPDKSLEPVSIWLSGWVEYNDTDKVYRNTFFNTTVELIERPGDVTTRRFFTLVLLTAVVLLAGYVFFGLFSSSKPKRAHSSAEVGTRSAADSDWGVKIYKQKPRPAKTRSKKSSRSDDNEGEE